MCPSNVLHNWVEEFHKWLPAAGKPEASMSLLTRAKVRLVMSKNDMPAVDFWRRMNGSVLIISYDVLKGQMKIMQDPKQVGVGPGVYFSECRLMAGSLHYGTCIMADALWWVLGVPHTIMHHVDKRNICCNSVKHVVGKRLCWIGDQHCILKPCGRTSANLDAKET